MTTFNIHVDIENGKVLIFVGFRLFFTQHSLKHDMTFFSSSDLMYIYDINRTNHALTAIERQV